MKRAAVPFLLILILILVLSHPGPARADEFKLIPSLGVVEKYNDNIFYSTSEKQRDWITVLSPGLELVNRTERLDLNLKARINDIRYRDLTDLNDTDQFYTGRVSYILTERLMIGANGGYTRDSQPDRDIETTGLVLSSGRRESHNYGGFLTWRLHDLTMASVSYRRDAQRYDETLGSSDWWSQGVTLDVVHDLDKWIRATKGRMNFGYYHYHFTGNAIDNYTATMGFSHDFSEKWSLLVDAGGRYTRSGLETLSAALLPSGTIGYYTQESSKQGWGVVGQVVLAYKDEYTTANVTAKKDIMPASGYNGAADRTAITFEIRRRFTYELQGFVNGGWYLNQSDASEFSSGEIDERTLRAAVGLRYEFTRDVALEASYEHTKARYTSGTDADRNTFVVRLYLQHTLFEK